MRRQVLEVCFRIIDVEPNSLYKSRQIPNIPNIPSSLLKSLKLSQQQRYGDAACVVLGRVWRQIDYFLSVQCFLRASSSISELVSTSRWAASLGRTLGSHAGDAHADP